MTGITTCARVGTRANDAPCTFNGQCASAFCARNKNSVCGVCATPPLVGDSCVDSDCGRGQTCLAGANVCQAYIGAGQPCDAATCSLAGGCYTGAGAASDTETGTCKADVAAGMACDIVIGPLCKTPGRCVVAAGATSGTCTVPDPTVCH
jgi:hypothetical protein